MMAFTSLRLPTSPRRTDPGSTLEGSGMTRMLAAAAMAVMFAVPAMAQEKPVLTVYTYSSFSGEYGPGATIKERFEADCGCTLEWVSTDDAGTLLARLKLEGSSTKRRRRARPRHQSDGRGTRHRPLRAARPRHRRARRCRSRGPTTPSFPSTGAGSPSSTTAPSSPRRRRASRRWSTIPTGRASSSRIRARRRPGLGLLLWMQGDLWRRGRRRLGEAAPRIVTVTQGWSEAYGLFLKGEADMVLSYTTSPAYHIARREGPKYKAADLPEGHYLQVEVAGMTRSTDQPDLARKLPALHAHRAVPVGDPGRQLDVSGDRSRQPACRPPSRPCRAGEVAAARPAEVDASRRAWIDDWLAAMSRSLTGEACTAVRRACLRTRPRPRASVGVRHVAGLLLAAAAGVGRASLGLCRPHRPLHARSRRRSRRLLSLAARRRARAGARPARRLSRAVASSSPR